MNTSTLPAPSLAEVAQALQAWGGVLHGDGSLPIARIAPLEHAGPQDISFLAAHGDARLLDTTQAACLIVAPAMQQAAMQRGACIVAANPYACFARLTQWWKQRHSPAPAQRIHPSAVIDPQAQVHPSATIGPLCVVARGACIGADTRLVAQVTVAEGCTLGARCIVHPGVVIGADGFGFAPCEGQWVKIEQLGVVRIGDDVEIGANTCIDRGALGDTVIEDGVKLDNLIQIAHNVHVGAHAAMAGCAAVAGSAHIGAGCTIGGAARVLGHLRLAPGVHISATSLVTRSIAKAGTYTGVFPLDDNAAWEKNAAALKQLHKLRERVRALEQSLQDTKK